MAFSLFLYLVEGSGGTYLGAYLSNAWSGSFWPKSARLEGRKVSLETSCHAKSAERNEAGVR